MIDEKIKKNINDLIYSLNVKYNLFYSNHQYKDKHFQNPEDYKTIQSKLADEIQFCENEMIGFLKKFIKEISAESLILAYDSRTICVVEGKKTIGNVLMKNITDDQVKEIQTNFQNEFDFNINIDLFENLDEESKKRFTSE